jgi:anaerobic magnesium-protoporphyrin IX monomethyl ester cyclase
VTPKVVLFYPPYDGPPLSAPLCLLSLAGALLESGIEARVIDAAVTPDWPAVLARELKDAVSLGISVLTGPMIRGALRAANIARACRPDLPVIFGGWHPSLVPEQTLRNPLVDVIVRGQGERTLLELVQQVLSGGSTHGIRGTSWREGDRYAQAFDRPVENLNHLPTPAYHLADYDEYARVSGARKLSYATSVGCPYACHYCTDQVFYKRRFNAYSAERVGREVPELVEHYRIEEVALLDSNFPVDVHRAVAIARSFVASGVRFRWTFQASTDFLCRMTEDDVRVMAQSGLTHMGFGTESASPDVLALMNKKHQRIDEMYETARKAELAGIHVTYNLIFGYPGETEADRVETLRIMGDIARRHWNVSFSPNIFTPYPGIPIWPQLRELGVHEPQSMEEWADLPLGQNVLPWLQGEDLKRLRVMLQFFLLNNQIRKATKSTPALRRGFRRMLGAPVRWRLRKSFFRVPWELAVARVAEKVIMRRSLITGVPLREDMNEAC